MLMIFRIRLYPRWTAGIAAISAESEEQTLIPRIY